MTTRDRADIYQTITDRIITAIEAGAGDWQMPWHVTPGSGGIPINATSRRAYRGINTVVLWSVAKASGYAAPIWGTYKQWQDLGAQVRKGEKSAPVVFWKPLDGGEDQEGGEDGQNNTRSRFVARGYHVFNAAQVDGFEAPALPVAPDAQRISHAEAFFAALGADIRHGGNRAFYTPAGDFIQMPPFPAFCDPLAYYATLAHEATHWTGHKSRCDRDLNNRFGSEAYAAEELIAELGAAFLCVDLALASEPRPDHAAYIESWLKVLKGDKRAIFTASTQAQKAADWIHQRQPQEGQMAA